MRRVGDQRSVQSRTLPVLLAVAVQACHHRDVAVNEPRAASNETHDDARASTSVAEAPVAEAPVAEAPITEAPIAEAPITEAPIAKTTDAEPPTSAPIVAAPTEPSSLLRLPGATVQASMISADGLRLGELACQVESMPLFGTLAIVASLAKHDRALDRCAVRGDATIATWTFAGGRTSDVEVSGAASAKVDACVRGVLKKIAAPFDARCSAVFLVGADTGADAGLARLQRAASE